MLLILPFVQRAWLLRRGEPPLAIAQPPEGAIKGPLQFPGRAVDGLLQSRSLMADRHRLATRETGFQQAAFIRFIVVAEFVSAPVPEVGLHPGDLVAEPVQGIRHHGLDLPRQRFAA